MMYQAALYCRLSKEDDTGTESSSITTQKQMLARFARERGFSVYDVYVDEGFSGTNFDRPGFTRLMRDIEQKKINLVITKDLSRLGRDYLRSGQLMEEYFPLHHIRYIAVTDGFDSSDADNDMAPFRNVLNELYARDTSKKIRSAFLAKMKEGRFVGSFAPYGYRKSAGDHNRLEPDPAAAGVVAALFRMAAQGVPPSAISASLNAQGIPPPSAYRLKNGCGNPGGAVAASEWSGGSVRKLLKNRVYLGHTVQHKTTKLSFKSSVTIANPPADWIVTEHTHEPLVDENTFDMVQRMARSRRLPAKSGFRNAFSGIARCADCGAAMSVTASRRKDSPYMLVCGRYKLYGTAACSNHFLSYTVLEAVTREVFRRVLCLSEEQMQMILCGLQAGAEKPWDAGKLVRRRKAEQETVEMALRALTRDFYLGEIEEKLYRETAAELESRLSQLACLPEEQEQPPAADRETEEFVHAGCPHDELNAAVLCALIDRIEVCQGVYEPGEAGRQKAQTVRVWLRFRKSSINSSDHMVSACLPQAQQRLNGRSKL